MDPSSKNWLSLFVDELQANLQKKYSLLLLYLSGRNSFEDFAHFYIHTSGLFYGYIPKPLLADYRNSHSWSQADTFKIALTQGLFFSYLWEKRKELTVDSIPLLFVESVDKLYDFFVLFTMHDAESVKYRAILSKQTNKMVAVEHIIDSRIKNTTLLDLHFWKGSQFNIYASLDVIYFSSWLNGKYAYDRKEIIKKNILTAITEASKSEEVSKTNGERLVSFFTASGTFLEGDVQNVKLDFSDIVLHEPPIMRLLIYEYAAYVCLSDTLVNKTELEFLSTLARRLQVSEYAAQESLASIENFIVQEGENIFYLQYGSGFDVVRKAFSNRVQEFIQKNKTKIVAEILGSKELVMLIRKSRNEALSVEEKEKIREQILDLLKTIPSLAIFMIPGGTFILPILYKILPEEIVMPSSFINKKNEAKF